jgi:dTDP-4-dehydrorhamnose reductase
MAGGRYLIIGAGGQLGHDLVKTFDGATGEIVALTHGDIEVCDHEKARAVTVEYGATHVIDLAAFHKTDECEEEIEKAFRVNCFAAANLASICAEIDAVMVYVSTDYVFNGKKATPWAESDPTGPINVYGMSKRAGESMVEAHARKFLILRVSGLYGAAGASGKGGNFVETMIRLAKEGKEIKVVDDQVLSPTYTRDLAEKIWEILKTDAYGTYHCTNSGACSWYEFAREIFRQTGLNPKVGPQSTKESGTKAARPAYSVLGNFRLKETGIREMRPWRVALSDYLFEKHGIRQRSA